MVKGRARAGETDHVFVDFAGEGVNRLDNLVSFDVGFVVVSGQFTADLVLPF